VKTAKKKTVKNIVRAKARRRLVKPVPKNKTVKRKITEPKARSALAKRAHVHVSEIKARREIRKRKIRRVRHRRHAHPGVRATVKHRKTGARRIRRHAGKTHPHTVFLIHSTQGSPDEAWYPWLKQELHKLGCHVVAPQFPTPEGQNLFNWLHIFDRYRQQADENAIFVGRSVAVPFILRILTQQKAKAAFLVAGFCSDIGSGFREYVETFVEDPFDWPLIRSNCRRFFVYYSDSDPYITIDKLKEVPQNLGVVGRMVKNAGHFNQLSGYDRFQLILRDIKKVMREK
jgi:hypothetical protein